MYSQRIKLLLICLLCGIAIVLNVDPCLAINQKDISVKLFGAKGDGVTDDSPSIQKAINSLKDGGTLFFPKGQYVFEQTLNIPSNVRILGDSKRSTTLLYKGTDKAIVSGDRIGQYGTGSYYLTIEEITIRGANDSGTGLYITSRYLTINNTEISHFATGIDCQFCWTNKFYNVSFFYDNIALKGGALLNANSFVNCIFSTGIKAVTFKQGWNISFFGCQFEGYTDSCFSFNDEYTDAIWNLNINGCYFENSGKCIDVGTSCSFYQLSFSNNTITTHGTGLAFNVNNSNNFGKNTGLVENNTFFRDNNGTTESFVHLEGPAFLIFRNNRGYASPDNSSVELLDTYTKDKHTSSIEEDLSDSNRLNFSGTGAFNKGVIIGNTLPASIDQGLLIYDNGKLKIYLDSSQSEYLQTSKSGPSSNRPTDCFVGMMYFDTTLDRPIWWDGSKWVDVNGEIR